MRGYGTWSVTGLLCMAMMLGVGCVGVKYKPLLGEETTPAQREDGIWIVGKRAPADDERLFWCSQPGGGVPICVEVALTELEERQLRQPFRTGLPALP